MNTVHIEHPSTEHLQRSFDGDLPKSEAAGVRAHVASCGQCQRELDRLRRLGDLVRLAMQPEAGSRVARGAVPAAAASTDPEAPAAAASTDPDKRQAIHPDDDAFARMFANIESALDSTAAHSAPQATRTPPRLRLVYRAAPALGAVALAAAALLMVYRPDTTPTEIDEAPFEAVASVAHSEIVEVDFGSNAGTVFDIPLSDGSSIPVVWIDDDDDEE